MELVEGTKYARKCSVTGEGIDKGYCIGDGEDYAKDDAALNEHFKWKDAFDAQRSFNNGEYYWTEWEMPADAQYIVKNGELVEIEETEEDITSQRIHELKDEPGVWAFVIANFPNYETSEDIAYIEELRKIIEGGELDKNAQSLFEETFESDLNHVKREYNYMHAKVYGEAIQNFIKKPDLLVQLQRIADNYDNVEDLAGVIAREAIDSHKQNNLKEPSFKFEVKKIGLKDIRISFNDQGCIKSFCGTNSLGESHDLPIRWTENCDNIEIKLIE